MSEACWPEAEWGQPLFSGTARECEHIKVDIYKCPEGALQVLRCEKCSGLSQTILDLRSIRFADRAEQRALLNDVFTNQTTTLFVEEHEDCVNVPIAHVVPETVQRLTEFSVQAARDGMAKGEQGGGMAALLMSDGRVILIDISGIPASHEGPRRQIVYKMHYEVREAIRKFGMDPLAISLVTEAWKSSDLEHCQPTTASDRQEIVVVSEMTTAYARVGMADIVRESGEEENGPGWFGDIQWMDGASHFLLLEGLLAL